MADRIRDTLDSPATQRINFFVGTQHIDSQGFQQVSRAILKWLWGFREGVAVEIGETSKSAAPAQYLYKDDRFTFVIATFGRTPDQRGAMVHECVHAMIDIQRGSPGFTQPMNEAAAYIAGALYFIYATGRPIDPATQHRLAQPSYAKANQIALAISDKPGAAVADADTIQLVNAVVQNPTYSNIRRSTPVWANGIFDPTYLFPRFRR